MAGDFDESTPTRGELTDRIAVLEREVGSALTAMRLHGPDPTRATQRHLDIFDLDLNRFRAAAEALGRARAEREWAERMRVKPLDAIAALRALDPQREEAPWPTRR